MKSSFLQDEQAQQGVMDALVDEILSGQGIAGGLYERLEAMDEQQRAAA